MALEISAHTREAVASVRPRLRGMSHRLAFVASLPVGVASTLALPAGTARLAGGLFALGVSVMLGCSALLHLRPWPERLHERWLRLDRSGIYVTIMATIVPIALLGLEGAPRTAMIVFAAVAGSAGIVLEWLPPALPRGVPNGLFLTMSWLPVVAVPALYQRVGAVPVLLLLGGGVLYTVGASILGMRRPDPFPRWFGYHEIWHLLVLGAVALHFAMVHAMA